MTTDDEVLDHTKTAADRKVTRQNITYHIIKSNQIALLAKAPLIRSTGAPSTGLQLSNMEQNNAYKEVFKKLRNP